MTNNVDLLWLGDVQSAPKWPMGEVHVSEDTPQSVSAIIAQSLHTSNAEAWLVWDGRLGLPDVEAVQHALALPGDVWHAGLRLGTGGQPELIDFVAPTWMLNRDPGPALEATSWRVSLRACLLRCDVLQTMGGPHAAFKSLDCAALEMGHRYIMRGVQVRHVPRLLPERQDAPSIAIPFEDEVRFAFYRFGRTWGRWALGRAMLSRYASPLQIWRAGRSVLSQPPPGDADSYTRQAMPVSMPAQPTVSVIIPTLARYDYLRVLLGQLARQTIPPLEIIVIDQTPPAQRDDLLSEELADLPLTLVHRDQAGQCSSRNAGIQLAQGDYILLLDDDDEVPADLIEAHLKHLVGQRAEVSSGAVDEVGAGKRPLDFTYARASDVFPTNNTLLSRGTLRASGLFDMAYEHGPRADGDLGMRIYLEGTLMRYTPNITVLHHHAARGGLRSHGARVVTYASSRRSVTQRHLPAVTEIYLMARYFSVRQMREALWLRAFGTLAGQSSRIGKGLKVLAGLVLMPDTLLRIRRTRRAALRLLEDFPQIALLEGD